MARASGEAGGGWKGGEGPFFTRLPARVVVVVGTGALVRVCARACNGLKVWNRQALEAVEKAGGSVERLYFNRLALRALLKPDKFDVTPKCVRGGGIGEFRGEGGWVVGGEGKVGEGGEKG